MFRRRLFAFLSAVSLVFCAQAAFLATIGRQASFVLPFIHAGNRWQVVSGKGEVVVNNQPQVEADRWTRESPASEHKQRVDARAKKVRNLKREMARNPRMTVDQDRVHAQQVVALDQLSRELAQEQALGPNTPPVTALVVRHEHLTAAFGVLPACWLIGTIAGLTRRWRRRATHCCLACGYDLRGSPGRCPECGTVPGT